MSKPIPKIYVLKLKYIIQVTGEKIKGSYLRSFRCNNIMTDCGNFFDSSDMSIFLILSRKLEPITSPIKSNFED